MPTQSRMKLFARCNGLMLLTLAGAAALLTGCGMAGSKSVEGTAPGGAALVHLSGSVHGGQQPIAGATLQLYTVGTTGLKSASTPLIVPTTPNGPAPTTDAGGNFNITGMYSCTNATQVYLVATGGNPGAGTNSAIAEVAALGACSSLSASTRIQMNEITTVAAAYALAPFAADLLHVGAPATNASGMAAAFANASLLANNAIGAAGGANLGAGVVIPNAEINTLSDILAACVNTTGASSQACSTLFSATGATDTFGAALGIARNPGASAVTALYSLQTASAPFQPTLTAQPPDFTVAVASTGAGGFAAPYGVAVDANGNAWVTNEAGTTITELSPTMAVAATATVPGLSGPQGVAVDRGGNIWVANTAGNSVVKFTVAGGVPAGISFSGIGGLNAPSAVAIDSAGNAFVANFNGNSVTELSPLGVPLNGSPFTGSNGNLTVPSALAIGPAGNVYVTSGSGAVVKLSNTGIYTASLSDSVLQGPSAVAVDGSGRVAVTGYTTGTAIAPGLSEFAPLTGAPAFARPASAGLSTPSGIATDGSNLYVTNGGASGGLAVFAIGSSTPSSPAAGFGSLNAPTGVALDNAGCVWTANTGSNTVSRFIGLALPVATPLAVSVGP